MTWKSEIKKEIVKHGLDLGTFTLQEFYRYSLAYLKSIHKDNTTCEASIRANLQKLRDEGYLIFIEKGVYKVSSLENDEFIHFVEIYHNYQS
jgi:predicted transcriptional regulator of viral defense system